MKKIRTLQANLVEVPNILREAAEKAILDKLRCSLEPYVKHKVVQHDGTFDIYAEIQILEEVEE